MRLQHRCCSTSVFIATQQQAGDRQSPLWRLCARRRGNTRSINPGEMSRLSPAPHTKLTQRTLISVVALPPRNVPCRVGALTTQRTVREELQVQVMPESRATRSERTYSAPATPRWEKLIGLSRTPVPWDLLTSHTPGDRSLEHVVSSRAPRCTA